MKQNIDEANRISTYAKIYILALLLLCFSSLVFFTPKVFILLLPMMCLNIISNYWVSYKIQESLKICKRAEEKLFN